jgi:chemotaxis protein MotB
MTTKLIITILLLGLILSACVSSKKYKTANTQLEQANTEIQKLKVANDELTTSQKQLQDQNYKMAADNKTLNQEFSQYKSACENSNKKLIAMEAAAKQEDEILEEMAEKIADAVMDFKDKGIEVYSKDRLIYVNMEDKLLYKTGSATLGTEGKEALAAIAMAVNDYPNLKILVVGNTDDQKFKSGNSDNLSLSTERANGVVRVLRDTYKVDATRLTSAGQGKYNPVADNATAEGRAKNRRTEIILRPDFYKLYESVSRDKHEY